MQMKGRVTRPTHDAEYLEMVRRVIKAAGKRVSMADPEDLAKLIAIREELDQAIQAAVDGLREDGFTWRTIGEATGTTGQAANMKWGKGGEVAEGADNVRYVEIDTEWAVNHSHTVTVGE